MKRLISQLKKATVINGTAAESRYPCDRRGRSLAAIQDRATPAIPRSIITQRMRFARRPIAREANEVNTASNNSIQEFTDPIDAGSVRAGGGSNRLLSRIPFEFD